jgi:hypothetical protein
MRNIFTNFRLAPDPAEGGTAKQPTVVAQLETAQAEVTRLTGEVTRITNDVTAAGTEKTRLQGEVTRITGERDTAQASLKTITGERDTARTELKTAQDKIVTLEASQKDFDGKVRAELLKHGVRAEAITLPKGDDKSAGAGGEKKLTLTEQCLAANTAKK